MQMIISLLLIVFALIGSPLFCILAGFALFAFSWSEGASSAVIVEAYRLASAPTLLTIPLFTLAGYILAESKAPQRLLRFAQASLGWLPGGVPIVSLIICAFFTAFTGASGVTIIALGGLLYPMMKGKAIQRVLIWDYSLPQVHLDCFSLQVLPSSFMELWPRWILINFS